MAAGAFCAKTAWGDDPKASQQPGRVVSPKSPPIRSRAPGALRSAVHPKSRYSVLPSNVFKAPSNRLQIVLNRGWRTHSTVAHAAARTAIAATEGQSQRAHVFGAEAVTSPLSLTSCRLTLPMNLYPRRGTVKM